MEEYKMADLKASIDALTGRVKILEDYNTKMESARTSSAGDGDEAAPVAVASGEALMGARKPDSRDDSEYSYRDDSLDEEEDSFSGGGRRRRSRRGKKPRKSRKSRRSRRH